jgi:hypothetical protein
MSFQAYIDNIKTKTGKSPEDFKKLAEKKGLLKEGVKAGEIVSWLKENFDLGHGHSMAIYATFKGRTGQKRDQHEAIESHFQGAKSVWRPVFEEFMTKLKKLGDDIVIAPTKSYLSILRGHRKIAILQTTAARMDIGIKLKRVETTKRFEPAGKWNTMMTHRVAITDAKQIDKE